MVPLQLVQGAIVGKAKAQAGLVTLVGQEIREDSWQGADFKYPAIRVAVDQLVPDACWDRVEFTFMVFSEEDSSLQCSRIVSAVVILMSAQVLSELDLPVDIQAGVVNKFKSNGLSMRSVLAPYRAQPRLWRADAIFTCKVWNSGALYTVPADAY